MKKPLLVLIIIIILSAFYSCNKVEPEGFPLPDFIPFSVEAGQNIFVVNPDIKLHKTVNNTINIGRYEVDRIDVDNGLIIYTKDREEASEYTKAYAVKSVNGDDIITFSLDGSEDVVAVDIIGNFISVKNPEGLTSIFNLDGEKIISDLDADETEFTNGYIRAKLSTGKSIIYKSDGSEVFNIFSRPNNGDTVIGCGDYLLERSAQTVYIFDNSGFLVKDFLGSESETFYVDYLSGNNFLIRQNKTVNSTESYDIYDGEKYIDQTLFLYQADKDKMTKLKNDLIIYDVANSYLFPEMTKQLKDGYTMIKTYNIDEDKVINYEKPYTNYIIDKYFNLCLSLDDGVFPFLYFKGDAATENNGFNLRLIGFDGKIIWEGEEEINAVLGYNDNVMTIGRLIDNKLKYGAYDRSGNKIVDYEYDSLSMFYNGVAIGVKDGNYYKVNKDGTSEAIDKEAEGSNTLYGFYIVEGENTKSLYGYGGETVIGESYYAKEIKVYTDTANSQSYIVVKNTEDIVKVYKIS